MLRVLPSASTNLKKRLVKSPKIYLRDSGILHALLEIEEYDYLLANPIAGASWEGFVIENIIAPHNRFRPFFVRTSNGAEIDLVLERAGKCHLFECKLSKAPKPSRGFHELVDSMQPESAWVIVSSFRIFVDAVDIFSECVYFVNVFTEIYFLNLRLL